MISFCPHNETYLLTIYPWFALVWVKSPITSGAVVVGETMIFLQDIFLAVYSCIRAKKETHLQKKFGWNANFLFHSHYLCPILFVSLFASLALQLRFVRTYLRVCVGRILFAHVSYWVKELQPPPARFFVFFWETSSSEPGPIHSFHQIL